VRQIKLTALVAGLAATFLVVGVSPARADWWQNARNGWTFFSAFRGSPVLTGNIFCSLRVNSSAVSEMTEEELKACGVEIY
jgi:hypothetical protein